MKFLDPSVYNAVLSAESRATPLTEDQVKALKDELTKDPDGRGYVGKELVDVLWLLGNEYSVKSKARDSVPIKDWSRDELYNILLQAKTADGIPALIALEKLQESTTPEIAMLAKQALLTINAPLKSINLENPEVAQGFAALNQLGVLTSEVYSFITEMPDPNWQEDEYRKPRLWALFGEGASISLDELKVARG